MVPPKLVQDIAIHFDNLMGYSKVNSILVDGHFLPAQSITIVDGPEPPGYVTFRISLNHVRLIQDPDPEEDEID